MNKIFIISLFAILLSLFTNAQSLTNVPCAPLNGANQWTDGDCSNVSTAGFVSC